MEVIPGSSKTRARFFDDDFVSGYINFYVYNGEVLVSEFGDSEADTTAVKTLSKLFPRANH